MPEVPVQLTQVKRRNPISRHATQLAGLRMSSGQQSVERFSTVLSGWPAHHPCLLLTCTGASSSSSSLSGKSKSMACVNAIART